MAAISEKIISEKDSSIKLGVCFPGRGEMAHFKGEYEVTAYGYFEEKAKFHLYHEETEKRFAEIYEDFKPDVIHIFGTEYSHTYAACKAAKDPNRILIGIQGLCSEFSKHYYEGLPEEIINKYTLRDFLKQDNIKQQYDKFVIRGQREIDAIKIAGNVTGRTDWDKKHTSLINPNARYLFMNETLRSVFYEGKWDYNKCEVHSIFMSQGDYPIKGLHVMLEAMALIKDKYPDMKLYVSGNKITGEDTLKKKILIGEYGKYLRGLMNKYSLRDKVVFLGSINANEMKERYLKCNVYVSPSLIENSPNSVGEAMLLSVPTITSDVGGVRNLLTEGEEGFYFKSTDYKQLAKKITEVFESPVEKLIEMGEKASNHARNTHDGDKNLSRLMEIYQIIAES